jgi:integral membrane sensor domain MASE1
MKIPRVLNRVGIDYQNPHWCFDVLIIAFSYYLVSWLVLKKMPVSPYGTPVWPGTGFVIGLLLLWGRSRWLGVFLGATLANYIGIKPLILAILGGIGTTLRFYISLSLFRLHENQKIIS